MTQTFEEWWRDIDEHGLDNIDFAAAGWHARDTEVAEKDRRIAELQRDLVDALQPQADGPIFHEAFQSGRNSRNLEVAALEARIEAGMALAEKYGELGKRAWKLTGVKQTYADVADELRAALGEPVSKP